MNISELPSHYILRNCLWTSGEELTSADIEVIDGKIGRITAPGAIPSQSGCSDIDIAGKLVHTGLCDVHVHLRQPGFEAKETIASGAAAALHGGFTAVCAMPNLNPTPDSVDHIEEELKFIRRDACIQVLPYAAITIDRKGREIVDINGLKQYAVAFSDDGSGVQDPNMMKKAMEEAASLDVIIAAHCEDNSLLHGGYIHDGEYAKTHNHKGICSESEWGQIARDLKLAEETGCHYHVCHISTKESVSLIRDAKRRGVKVTCETGPHYLVMCDSDLQEEGRFKMNPPLRSAEDRNALIEGIKDGTIDCIATDHAPHTAEEKSRGLAGSAMGVVGLETSFGVCYTHLVKTGILTLPELLKLMCDNPRRIFRIDTNGKADFSIFDLEKEWIVNPEEFVSMGKATPFEGMHLKGKPCGVIYNGKMFQF